MKTTLWMATTINGYVAGLDDDTDWVKDLEEFKKRVAEFGIAVMGRRTYDECIKYNTFPYEGALNIVMTHSPNLLKKSSEKVIFTNKNPREVIDLAKEKGFDKVLVIGGGHINGSFLKENLLVEVFLDIHPLIITKGTQLFESDFPYKNLE